MTRPDLKPWELRLMAAELRDLSKHAELGSMSVGALQRLLAQAADAIDQLQRPDLFTVLDRDADGRHFCNVAVEYFSYHVDKIGEPVPFLATRNCGQIWGVARTVDIAVADCNIAIDWFPNAAEAKMAALRAARGADAA